MEKKPCSSSNVSILRCNLEITYLLVLKMLFSRKSKEDEMKKILLNKIKSLNMLLTEGKDIKL